MSGVKSRPKRLALEQRGQDAHLLSRVKPVGGMVGISVVRRNT